MPELNLDFVRSLYPAKCWDWAFFENAGGSYVPESVITRVTDYMRQTQVQPGASYEASAKAAQRIALGQRLMAELIGADSDEVIIGPSTTTNIFVLSKAFAEFLDPGDEVIVTNLDHEANIGAWRRLEQHGIKLKEWPVDPETERLQPETLDDLLSDKTRLVCFSHCSNILGGINDAKAITRKVHDAGALVCVDGVAYAPHRAIDVKELDVDFYVLSLYKLFGPHVSLLYAKRQHLERLPAQNHYFLDDQIPLKLNPGGPNHEFTAALVGIADYFDALAAHHLSQPPNTFKARADAMFEIMSAHEDKLAARFNDFLASKTAVRLFGPGGARTPTFSFIVDGKASSEIATELEKSKIAIGCGRFYANRLVDALGVNNPEDGVLRVSMAHYNTMDEVERLITALDGVL
ncbi:MAG: aminotransferase class V-fold PLP-dependent enzyme [Proteobacteria bacterium]|nr:aminotransferase class V-fold PLP-dependent enzyme [Pseudomonadota bacterium]MDA1022663.1 aminotransferase class V-fold PLP-dependent enzyme [Pseudomonadota bacterium]